MATNRRRRRRTSSGTTDPANPNFGPEVVIPPGAVSSDTVITAQPGGGGAPGTFPSISNLLPQIIGSLFAREQTEELALRDVSILLSTLQLTTQLSNTQIRRTLQKAVLAELTLAVQAIQPQ